MSTIRNPATITSVGRRMMTAGGDITYTKAVLYGQDISHLTREQLESLTSIGNPLVTVPLGISDKNDNGNGTTVILEATFQNSNLKADLPYTAVGFFAKRGDDAEKLIAVGVATEGAYLAATSPDGVATDALDIKVAIAIGDSANVTAMIDPAGSVTPAALHNAITDVKSEMKTGLDTKADKSTVDSDVKSINDTLATKADKQTVTDDLVKKADKTDVASDVKSLQDSIGTKANQSDLDKTNAVVATKANATALADYARTVDVDADLDTKANKTDLESLAKTADVNSALDTKADKATVNSDIKTINDTMATKASQSDLDKTNATVATKADKTTVDGDVKTLQASIDTKADKTALDDYAKSADVASDVKTLTDSIATKADAKTVNDAISKIDFTPYAKSADVDSKLKGYTDTADLTKLLAGKADSDFSYSKAELDKKLLDLTTTKGGKVDANQVATMIENKADKSDVTKQIGTVTDLVNTKANSTDVTAALDKKDDITDVDAKIKKVTDLANTKANVNDIYNRSAIDTAFSQRDSKITNLQNSALQVIEGHAGDDILSFRDDKVRVYDHCQNVKNLPPMANELRFYTVTRLSHDWGSVTVISQDNCYWQNVKNNDTWAGWTKHATSADIDNLTNQINQKANSSDVYTKKQVDDAFSSRDATIATKADTATVNSQVADAKNAATKAQTAADNANNNANGRLSLNGGRMGSTAQISFANSGTWSTSSKPAGKRGGLHWEGQSDSAEIYADEDGIDNLDLVFQIGDDGSNHFSFRNQVGAEVAAIQSNGHYTGTIDWASVNGRPDVATHADVNNKVNVQGDLFRLATAGNTWVDILGVANSYTPVLVSIRDQGSGNLLGNYAAAIAFGGGDTKGVLNVAYSDHTARIIGGNGNAPVWHEDIAWKSDINSLNSTISALQQTVQSLQNTVNQQATQITGLQTQVNNQANEISYIKANYIEGKRFAKADESQATAWEKENSQRIAFIEDK